MLLVLAMAVVLAGVVAAGMSTFAGVLIIISSSMVRDVWIHGLGRTLSPAAERFVQLTIDAGRELNAHLHAIA